MIFVEQLTDAMREAGTKIGLPSDSPLYPTVSDGVNFYPDGRNIYVDGNEYHCVGFDRGRMGRHHHSSDLKTILYYVFDPIVFSLARKYEIARRVKGPDSRRMIFAKQMELMGQIDPNFAKKLSDDLEKVLKKYPYQDDY